MRNYILIALAAGAVLPVQALINGRLSASFGSAFMAGNISLLISTLALLLVQFATHQPFPSVEQAASVPAWAWFGGLLGVVYVVGAIFSVGAIGTTSAICLIIAGQIGAALIVDQLGILGAASNPLTWLRLFGAGLVVAGAVIVIRG